MSAPTPERMAEIRAALPTWKGDLNDVAHFCAGTPMFDRFHAIASTLDELLDALDGLSEHKRVFADIASERNRQDAEWGGASHDDEHGYQDWREYRAKFERRIHHAGLPSPFDGERWAMVARESLVKIAALAVAQIESLDRTYSVPSGAKE